jgi:hypothetical protein
MSPASRFIAWLACATFMTAALAAPRYAKAHTFCASTAAEFRQALADVSDDGPYVDESNAIRLVSGSYLTAGEVFRSDAQTTAAQLEIQGGWRSGCSSLDPSPTSTVLDAQGSGGVLAINRPHSLLSLKRLVVQNGSSDVGAGLQVNYGTDSAAIVGLFQVLIRHNHASGDGGGAYINAAAGPKYAPIQMNAVLIADNSSGGEGGGAYLRITGGGIARFGFFTVASNSSTSGVAGGLYSTGDQGSYWYRGLIAWGNTPASLYFDLPAAVDWSDYDTLAPGTSPTLDHVVNADPHFVDAAHDDYRLGNETPLIQYCPETGFAPADLAGHLLPTPGGPIAAEIGAYLDTIFATGDEG